VPYVILSGVVKEDGRWLAWVSSAVGLRAPA
jgi:hypothetical protein